MKRSVASCILVINHVSVGHVGYRRAPDELRTGDRLCSRGPDAVSGRETGRQDKLPLAARITCPHCWHRFPPEEIHWVAAHSDLVGDPLLGEESQQRFLPSRFDADGLAIDVKGVPCQQLACPRCHLTVPRAIVEMEPLFISILGAPSAGKSYFLAAMTWFLRATLPKYFRLTFADADPQANMLLNNYEEKLFLSSQPSQLARLPKTQLESDLYQSVRYGDRAVLYPRPFIFTLRPAENHANASKAIKLSRALCLYDNAGEQFLPGEYKPNSPGTDHLAVSRALLFLFDPTQHPNFRRACAGKSSDPQMNRVLQAHRQDQILLEAANRIRAQTKLAQHEKSTRPLIVVVTKYDAWSCLTHQPELKTSWAIRKTASGIAALDIDNLQKFSSQIKRLLAQHAPEIVAAAEAFSSDVTYLPSSALGSRPMLDEPTGHLAIRPQDIQPMWAEIPALYALYRASRGLIPIARSAEESHARS
jgi:hypothetical protein